jgi:hypothetical protein
MELPHLKRRKRRRKSSEPVKPAGPSFEADKLIFRTAYNPRVSLFMEFYVETPGGCSSPGKMLKYLGSPRLLTLF